MMSRTPMCLSCPLNGSKMLSHQMDAASHFDGISSDEGQEIEDNGWKIRLTSSLHIAWKEDLYTDLTLHAQDETIHAHKLVLAVASPYFQALLHSNLSESHTNILRLDTIKGEILRAVLEYIYTGKTRLKEENAMEVLVLADYLQIHDLKRLCCSYIKKIMRPSTCLPMYEFARLHHCYDLTNFAFEMALKNCSETICDPSFKNLQTSTLEQLLKQQILSISSEDELLKALMRWKTHDEKERKFCYASLLGFLNENLMSPFMKAVFLEEIEESRLEIASRNIFATSTMSFLLSKNQISRYKREQELLIVFGGESSGRILGNAECFSVGFSSWRCSVPETGKEELDLMQMEGQQVIPTMKYPRTSCAVASRGNVVYLIGGQNPIQFLSSCETYHLDSNEWGGFPDLPFCLHGAAATFINDYLWVVGGRNSDQSSVSQDTVLVYNPNKESWCLKPPMFEGRIHFGVATIHGYLFAIGGLGVNTPSGHIALSRCEKYDTETDTWTPIASLGQRRAYHGVAVIEDYIYVMGGYDGKQWLSSVERYNPFKDQWTMVSSMMVARSSCGVTVSHGRIYCIGGFSGESVLNSVEKYNPRTDMWHCVQSMQFRRYGLVASTLKLPSEKLIPVKPAHREQNH